jgi:hypothetical protein
LLTKRGNRCLAVPKQYSTLFAMKAVVSKAIKGTGPVVISTAESLSLLFDCEVLS